MHEEQGELLGACARGDQRAWSQLVDRYAALVYSVPRKHRLSDPDCDDVFQAVFAALLANIGSIRDAASLPQWLITSAQRECWRLTRARARTTRLEDGTLPVEESPPDDMVEALERRQAVRESLRELGGTCEGLLRALFTAGPERSYEDIGRELGLPIGSIGPTRGRCLGKLMSILAGRLGEAEEVESPGAGRI